MQGLPQYVDPLRLAQQEESIAGRLPVSAMPRLKEVLRDDSGTAEFRLKFRRDEQGLIRVLGEFSTSLRAVCQRCLEPLELPLAGTINVTPVSTETGTERVPAGAEPLFLSEGRIHLISFIEDEILLALPIAPVHGSGQCATRRGTPPDDGRSSRPFAALKTMNIRKD
jgi:uncharacterized protein